ncbi:MAG TPA: DNA mismatch repair endonuclease MutL [Tepidisphaeraceae bacterium]|nr:DNA mismatch repair endonuclease MutL [Tepidisphaeraceae bacterium]
MESRPIQQLPASLVNRIAAGEVIERPAAVVKELVENALDSDASQIHVEVEDGGRALVRVIDDGGGIPADELPLAFASHATSKLACDDDLFRIATMGFRGEALASIGAVSQARILSRIAEGDVAYEIANTGGAIGGVQAAAGNRGTTVEVRNLFFNTPARRKFIKGSATEFGHISETLIRLALPFSAVAFRLSHNGKVTVDLPAAAAEDRLLAAWPAEFREQRLPLAVRDAELTLRGLIGLPELARPTAKYQYFYLNGRHIRDRFIQHAVREAFRGLTEPGRHPAAILLLEIPPGDVDVNVHPTKTEVRFRDGSRIHGLVHAAVRERLLGSDLTPSAAATPVFSTQAASGEPGAAVMDLRAKLAAFFRAPAPVEQFVLPASPGTGTGTRTADGGPNAPGLPPPASPFAATAPPPAPAPSIGGEPSPAVAIQLHISYLVVQSDDGMLIIDQHALHERILYEELRARISAGSLESQRLLIPATFPVAATQLALLEHIQPLLNRLGIEAGVFGPAAVAVQAFPTFLHKLDPAAFVAELLERGEQELLDLTEEELLHEVLDMMACKAAVKAGDPLTGAEIDALVQRRDLVERSSNCPHGRPTTLRLSLRDLEKQFKRTGF